VTTVAPFGPLALSLEDLPGPAFVLDGPEGRVIGHNAAFAAWAGRDDVTGVTLAELLPGDPVARSLCQEARSAGASEHHVERRGRDGERSFWSLRARRTPAGVLVCAADLTALAGAAQAVHASARDYVAVAAHELRAPLSAIKAWASALDGRRGAPGPGDAEGLGAIARQVDRMNDLLTDLFDAARAGSGALHARRAPVAVEALVRGIGGGSVRPVIHGDLPGRVFVDAGQIQAVLGRLLGWIAGRQPGGEIRVDASVAGAEVHVSLLDPGPALSRRAEGDLFGRGMRGGRGLGLYLCQHLAAVNGGRVWREPVPDAGGAPAARLVLALPTEQLPGRRREGVAVRVLVGEADPQHRARGVAALRLEGDEVSGAADGAALFRDLEGGDWDVVVADPALLGDAPCAALQRMRASVAPPVIVVVAPSAERPLALDGAERAGALAVLGRPLDWPHLISLVGCAARGR
jgi:signal transduction histidine kinase/CheY-like chemotaxis protein